MIDNDFNANGEGRPASPVKKDAPKFQKPLTKLIFIGILVLLLLIPMGMIKNLINERMDIADDATKEVYQSWSGPQTVTGPVLSLTLKTQTTDADGKPKFEQNTYNILPNKLNINGNITTQELKRGIYEIVVYNAPIDITGNFVYTDELKSIMNSYNNVEIINASIYMGISDLRGISEEVMIQFGDQQLNMNSGLPIYSLSCSGLSSAVNIEQFLEGSPIDFSTTLTL